MPEGPFKEVEIIDLEEFEDRTVYLLRVKALSISLAKAKARTWTRINHPTAGIDVMQVLDPSTGGVLEGDVPHTIDIEDITEEKKPDVEGLAMRDVFDVQIIAVERRKGAASIP